jgi:MoaA/NifB/PqqE/SkfB family radical SAM enzyme
MLPGLHIEPTSRCTLGCPRCGRSVMLKKFGKKSLPIIDLTPSHLDNFIDVGLGRILICGNNGDPIYHRQFKDLLEVCKKHSKEIVIVTNGGHRSAKWWDEIVELFDEKIEIRFSIDGTPENFTKYRINGDWPSTLVGIKKCVTSKAKTVWKYIPFSFNEDNIEDTKKLALDLGFDEFRLEPSDRWEINDWLEPNNRKFINHEYKVKKRYKENELFIDNVTIDPKCKSNASHFINANGYYMPCCMLSDQRFYYKSIWWKNKEQYNIKTTKLSDQIKNFDAFYKTINTDKPDYCVFNCGKC